MVVQEGKVWDGFVLHQSQLPHKQMPDQRVFCPMPMPHTGQQGHVSEEMVTY